MNNVGIYELQVQFSRSKAPQSISELRGYEYILNLKIPSSIKFHNFCSQQNLYIFFPLQENLQQC